MYQKIEIDKEHKWSDHLTLYTWGVGTYKETPRKILLLGIGSTYKETPRKILLLGNSHYIKEWSSLISQDPIACVCKNQSEQNRLFSGIIWTLSGKKNELEEKYNDIVSARVTGLYERQSHKMNRVAETNFFTETIEKLPSNERLSFGYTFRYYLRALAGEKWRLHTVSENHDVVIDTMKSGGMSIPVYLLVHGNLGRVLSR